MVLARLIWQLLRLTYPKGMQPLPNSCRTSDLVLLHDMNRIEKLTEVQGTLQQLPSSEPDKFVAYLYQARKWYRLVCERPNKGNKAIEREVISSYQVAQGLGFNGDFRHWEHLLRIHE